MVTENLQAVLKDIKVTKKGITVNFEDVKLRGEDLQALASLIGEKVMLGIDLPQMSIFDDEVVNELDAPQDLSGEEKDSSELYNEAVELVVTKQEVSNFLLQDNLKIGYETANDLIASLQVSGIISVPEEGQLTEVLVKSMDELPEPDINSLGEPDVIGEDTTDEDDVLPEAIPEAYSTEEVEKELGL